MGDPAKADPALIEDFHWLDDPAWRFGGNYLHVEANYLLLVENLLDTTHLPFLHPTTLGTDAFARSEFEVKREGDRITVDALADERAAGAVPQADGRLSRRHEGRPLADHALRPALASSSSTSARRRPAPARARATARKGMNMWNLNAITPETEKTAHYFFAQAYNFKLDEPWISRHAAKPDHDIFLEDMAMIKAQQQNMDLGPEPGGRRSGRTRPGSRCAASSSA